MWPEPELEVPIPLLLELPVHIFEFLIYFNYLRNLNVVTSG